MKYLLEGPNFISDHFLNNLIIVGTPHPPLLKEGEDLLKSESLGGVGGTKCFARMGNKSDKQGIDVEMWGCHVFINLQLITFTLCWRSNVPFITFQIFSLLS